MRRLPRNKFNLSHDRYGTYEMGPLYPNLLIETVPGDSFEIVTEAMSRFEAMTSATYSKIDKFQYYFYIPKRLLFADYYEKYRFGGKDGTDTTVPPYMTSPVDGYAKGSLADHFGLPTDVGGYKHSAMPLRGYELINNNWFFNDHLDTFFEVSTAPGEDTTTNLNLVNKKWQKDRFTSALPTPQLAGPSYLPMGLEAPVELTSGLSSLTFAPGDGAASIFKDAATGTVMPNGIAWSNNPLGDLALGSSSSVTNGALALDVSGSHYATLQNKKGTADVSKVTAVSIPQMRVSIAVQQFLERLNRSGTRPVEAVLSTFGVRIPDYRLDRSEFLGGSRTPIMITPVEQTSESGTTPQGTLTGRGIGVGSTGVRCFCHEDGYIIGLVCWLPQTAYCQGLDKLWSRETRYDEYLPDFAGVGDQEIKNQEIYVQSDSVVDENSKPVNKNTFGYEDRYNEFRHMYSKVSGQYRPGGNMNDHMLTRQFDSLPQLNSAFVTADPSKRVFAVQTPGVDHIEAQFKHHIRAYRPLPRFGNPGLRKV